MLSLSHKYLIILAGCIASLFLPDVVLGNDSISLSLKYSRVHLFQESRFEKNVNDYRLIDTGLSGTQRVYNRYVLGSYGLPGFNLFLPSSPGLGFVYFQNPLDYISFSKQQLMYCNTKSPFTELFFGIAAPMEQSLKVFHSQNVTKNLNFSVYFNRVRSEGFYTRQLINDNNFAVSSNYTSSNKRYFLLAHAIYNGLNFTENGGIRSDSAFEVAGSTDKKLIDINLNDAQRRNRNRSIYIKQFFNTVRVDSVKKDSSTVIHHYFPTGSLAHSFRLEDNAFVYDDKNPRYGFYKAIYNDSLKTLDSVCFFKMENELSWRLLQNAGKDSSFTIGASLGVKHEWIKLNQWTHDTSFSNFILQASLYHQNLFSSSIATWNLEGGYVVKGAYQGDYLINGNLTVFPSRMFSPYLQITAQKRTPEYIYQRYFSNHFKWNYSFDKTGFYSADVGIQSERYFFKVGGTFYRYQRPLFFDSEASPRQQVQDVNVVSLYLSKEFHWGGFTMSDRIVYQQAPERGFIRVPPLVLEHTMYYNMNLFKKVLKAQLGVDVFYNSSYYSTAYMPATGQYFLQNKKQIGNYPFIDIFLNIKIRSARVFIKYEHFNSGFMDNRYYAAAGYPMADRALKFGINWRFFD